MEQNETKIEINSDGYWLYCVNCYEELYKPTPYCPYCGKKFDNYEKFRDLLKIYKDRI